MQQNGRIKRSSKNHKNIFSVKMDHIKIEASKNMESDHEMKNWFRIFEEFFLVSFGLEPVTDDFI